MAGGYELYPPSSPNSNIVLRLADFACPLPGGIRMCWRKVEERGAGDVCELMMEMVNRDFGKSRGLRVARMSAITVLVALA